MGAGLWLFGLEAKQIATSDTVGNGCEGGLKFNFIPEFSILTPHHRRDAPRDVPLEGPYRGAKGDQQVEVLTRRQGLQVFRKPPSQRRESKATNKRVTGGKLLHEILSGRRHAAMISAFADQEQHTSAVSWTRFQKPRRVAHCIEDGSPVVTRGQFGQPLGYLRSILRESLELVDQAVEGNQRHLALGLSHEVAQHRTEAGDCCGARNDPFAAVLSLFRRIEAVVK